MCEATCPRCSVGLDRDDRYCRACGWSLAPATLPADEVITEVTVEPAPGAIGPAAFLPALRADLAPALPTVRRAATVLVTAALTDWALRVGTRTVLREGLSLLGRASHRRMNGHATSRPRAGSETVIVERIIIHRP